MGNFDTKSLVASLTHIGRWGDDFCVGDVSWRPVVGHPFKMTDYGCVIGIAGEASGSIDLMPCTLRPMMMAVNAPGQLVEQTHISDDFKAIAVSMSPSFVRSLGLPYNFQIDRMLRDNPIIGLQQSQYEAMITYCRMVTRLLKANHPYTRETLTHLTCAFFYGLGNYLYQISDTVVLSNEEDITRRFVKEVKESFRRERQVGFYADRLHITSGYLSTVVKAVSGKSPSQWIEEFVAKEACVQLKCTTLSVQQIGNELNFPSQSFFGKYFKRVVGCSPIAYRER